jgi:NCS1 family nucleobase:cation symporter-1
MPQRPVEHAGAPVAEVAPTPRVAVETNGINVIAESQRKGVPRQLFWPWFGANVSVVGLAYGSFLLGAFGLGGKDGDWAYANLGVLVAFLVGLLGTLALRGSAVRAQEQADLPR